MSKEALNQLGEAQKLFLEGIAAAKSAAKLLPKDIQAFIKADQERVKAALNEAKESLKAQDAAIKKAVQDMAKAQKAAFTQVTKTLKSTSTKKAAPASKPAKKKPGR